MSAPNTTYSGGGAVGLAEDVSDLIHNISPTETPFLTLIGTTSATAKNHEWQRDDLAAPGDSARAEGAEASVFIEERANTTMLNNYTQINSKAFGVSGTYETVNKYGRDSELAYQAAKVARELKTDVDYAMTGVSQGSLDGSVGALRRSGSFNCWLANSNRGTGGLDPANNNDGSAEPTDGVVRAFAQDQLDDVIQQCWTDGGRPSVILAGPEQKTALSKFDGVGNADPANNITRSDRSTRTIWATADIYMSNFGRLTVIPSRHIYQRAGGDPGGVGGTTAGDREVYIVDPEYAKTAYLRPWQQFDLAKTGDSINRQMLVEWTLEVCNQDAHGVVADLGD